MKKIIAVILLIGSMTFAGLIIIDKKSFQPELSQNSIKNQPNPIETITAPPVKINQPNTTKEFVQKISADLKELNPNGPLTNSNGGLNAPNPETIVNQYLEDGIKKFRSQELIPSVDEAQLFIRKNNETAALENYLKSFQQILKNNFSGLAIDFTKLPGVESAKLITAYNKTIKDFYGLAVPEKMLAIHKDEIRFLGAQKNIFEYLKNYSADPMAALLALQANKKINNELASIKNAILTIIKQYNLKI